MTDRSSAAHGRAVPATSSPLAATAPAQTGAVPLRALLRDFYSLCKPRVTALIVFTALAGLLLAEPFPMPALAAAATCGIWLVAAAAAALNCILELASDRIMNRTRRRPLANGRITPLPAALFATVLGTAGLLLLHTWVNPLTMWLTLASLVGYSVVYTLLLKPYTDQNIVIGGAAGAMPPLLGWAAATGQVSAEAVVLFLIVFLWTPPHFWSLALYHRKDYAQAGFPMLPIVRGAAYTQWNILAYTVALWMLSLAPYALGMSGTLYLASALLLGGRFVWHGWGLCRRYSDQRAMASFRFSIVYLVLLFAALLADTYLRALLATGP